MMLTVGSDLVGVAAVRRTVRRRVGPVGAYKGLFPQPGEEGTGAPSKEVTEAMTGTEVVEIRTVGLVMDEQRGRYQKLRFGF